MDFNNIKQKRRYNIFNKELYDPLQLYNDILNNGKNITINEIIYLNNLTSVVMPDNHTDLRKIVIFYDDYYTR